MKNYAFVYIFMLYYMHICRVTDATTILVRMTQLYNISWPSRRDYLQKIFSLIYDAKEKTPSLILFFQKNVIELLLEKYFRSGKLIIRALFLQLTSGVDLFFTIEFTIHKVHTYNSHVFTDGTDLSKCCFTELKQKYITHMYKKNRQPDKHNKVRWSVLIL